MIGGDGARSRVARDLGLDENREWIVGVEDVLEGVPLEGPPQFHCFLDPRLAPGYLAWMVHDGEEAHVGVGGYAARFDPLRALESFREEVAGLFDFTRARCVERRGGRIPVGGVLERIANGRGLLIGDAAGAVSPLTAGGLDPCMRLSSVAASVSSVMQKPARCGNGGQITSSSGRLPSACCLRSHASAASQRLSASSSAAFATPCTPIVSERALSMFWVKGIPHHDCVAAEKFRCV